MPKTEDKIKVLIVEDDSFSLKYFETLISIEGYDCRIAENGKIGLEVFKEFKPDIVLSDIQMPEMDGLEMLAAIRRLHTDAIVIMATAFNSEEYAIKALKLGANDYLKKPVTPDSLKRLFTKYSRIIRNRNLKSDVLFSFTRKEFTLKIESKIEIVHVVADMLKRETSAIFDESERVGIELGLAELITNAIEHGNLEISFAEKSRAMEKNQLEKLFEEREENAKLGSRKVTIDFKQNENSCEWLITDEGEGFDWKAVPNPLESQGLEELHGRGIFISRFQFDEMEYLGNGNIVRLKKTKKENVVYSN